ncbi:MAG: 2-oxo-4-hydroxy-4-carboxy-5-ureidoimidazoline decarboxylase [Cryomorphaceae bacterium]|jgi:2-oxo-4-hydroxy-4-carboxy-5-ureidoimidazoline decarboxylase
MPLSVLNNAKDSMAREHFLQCCSSAAWVNRMLESRPFESAQELFNCANTHWQNLTQEDYLQAFDGHPKIGDVGSLRAKYANTKELAAGEQTQVNAASEDVMQKLAQGNADYQDKFGFIFIVCATGKSAQQMLALLLERIENDRDTELLNAAEEQRKIFQLRLQKLMEAPQ